MSEKKHKAKPTAEYSLQFYWDRHKTINILETSNMTEGRSFKDIKELDLTYFAMKIADSELLDENDKKNFGRFCHKYLDQRAKNNL